MPPFCRTANFSWNSPRQATERRCCRRLRTVKLTVRAEGPTRFRDERHDQLAALFDENYDSLYRFALARCGSPLLAEEICAETFAEAARWYAQESSEPVSVGWLLTVARRRLVDHWRATDRQRRRFERFVLLTTDLDRRDDGPGDIDDTVFDALRCLHANEPH